MGLAFLIRWVRYARSRLMDRLDMERRNSIGLGIYGAYVHQYLYRYVEHKELCQAYPGFHSLDH